MRAVAPAGSQRQPVAEPDPVEAGNTERPLMVDAHVHIHGCFDPPRFLNRAWRNFDRAARRSTGLPPAAGCLMLSESRGADAFGRFRWAAGASFGGWRVETTDETCSLRLRGEEACLLLIAGRQIVTAEGLEVLALGCDERFEDERPIHNTLELAVAAAAITVLPWGFGKWSFRRRRLVESIVRSAWSEALWLGDNAGRLRYGPRPRLFDLAAERGMGVLPGSDPLPLGWHVGRAGRRGFLLPGDLDQNRPAGAISDHLRRRQHQPERYGRGSGLVAFVRDQAALRMPRREEVE